MNKEQELKADKRLLLIYKVPIGWYAKQLKLQNGGCWICGRFPRNLRLFVDHDHTCCKGKPPYCGKCTRYLLCMICNRKVLGVIEKYKIPAKRIVLYLEQFKGKDAL